jgi:co-chaperonin GroES (HSP10)
MAADFRIYEGNLKPIKTRVLVTDMNFEAYKTKSGLIIPGDDGVVHGIKPRWAKVLAVGPKAPSDLKEGDWILIQHGRWSRGIKMQDPKSKETKTIWMVESESILLRGDHKPDDYYSAKVIN